MNQSTQSVSPVHAWILGARPRTLPTSASPVILGTAVAFTFGGFRLLPALAAFFGGILIQIGANFSNDLFDYEKGVDNEERLGPTRVTQSGMLSPRQVRNGTIVAFGLASLLGIYLTYAAGWVVIAIGVLSILAALGYVGGPHPYGYRGFGEIFVFLFFGLAALCGTVYVQMLSLPALAWWAALPMGFLSTAVLVVNNLRDIPTDLPTGKKTLAVRFGDQFARREYLALVILSYLAPLGALIFGAGSAWGLMAWLSLPVAIQQIRIVWKENGRPLNAALGGTGKLELIFALCYAAGLILQRVLA